MRGGTGESDSTVYPACTLSQVSRVDELLWALAADLEEQWLVGVASLGGRG